MNANTRVTRVARTAALQYVVHLVVDLPGEESLILKVAVDRAPEDTMSFGEIIKAAEVRANEIIAGLDIVVLSGDLAIQNYQLE